MLCSFRRGGIAGGATRAGGLAANSTRRTGNRKYKRYFFLYLNVLGIVVTGYGTSRRLTHGTTTMSNAEEDHDRKVIGDKTFYIKPKSMYPDRDDGREKQPTE